MDLESLHLRRAAAALWTVSGLTREVMEVGAEGTVISGAAMRERERERNEEEAGETDQIN